jgi:hypothetical protein
MYFSTIPAQPEGSASTQSSTAIGISVEAALLSLLTTHIEHSYCGPVKVASHVGHQALL